MSQECGAWGRQHSGASQACIWEAVQALDIHSLLRQSQAALTTFTQQRQWRLPSQLFSTSKVHTRCR